MAHPNELLTDIDDDVWKAERRANYPRLGKEKVEEKKVEKRRTQKKSPNINLYDKVSF